MTQSHPFQASPDTIVLTQDQFGTHHQHWRPLIGQATVDEQVPTLLSAAIEHAALDTGLVASQADIPKDKLLISGNATIHINQVLAIDDNKRPKQLLNAFPCVQSNYVQTCQIIQIMTDEQHSQAVLKLQTQDGVTLFTYDQLYAVNRSQYRANQAYEVHLSGIAYAVEAVNERHVLTVTDPDAIHHNMAVKAVLAQYPDPEQRPENIERLIEQWMENNPLDIDINNEETLQRHAVKVNLKGMCAYLHGDTMGQQDEAWVQGRILGLSYTQFNNRDITLVDAALVREPDSKPVVARLAVDTDDFAQELQINDYFQANVWIQAAIYAKKDKN